MALREVLALAPKAGAALLSAGADAASSFDVTTVMSEAVTKTQGQVFGVLGIVVPAIVAITAAIVGIKFGVGWLRKIKG